MTTSYANIAYAPFTLEYDRERFIYEYDRYILPRSRPILNGSGARNATVELNRQWGMIDPEIYSQQNVTVYKSWHDRLQTGGSVENLGNPSWMQAIMTQMITSDSDDESLKDAGVHGRLAARNFAPEREWKLKDEFSRLNLEIVDFIYKRLCLSRIVWVNCVSLEPGRCAIIHRDNMPLYSDRPNPAMNNSLVNNGYVVITLNITNGGVPLYWSLDDCVVRFADDSAYLNSDYFLHGVPIVTSRRRQIRITGVPGEGFDKFIDRSQAVILPDDYQYIG
jgi:hypothetical protein